MTKRRDRDKGRLEPFVPLLKETLASPAWRTMSHGARSLYVALKLRYSFNFKNNGRIYLSQRHAVKELGSGFEEIANWFRELQHYGFIVLTEPGCLGLDGMGKSPHWRLTELGYMRDPPTRDFLKWGGTKYKGYRRAGRGGKQNPATERRSTLLRKGGAPPLRKGGAVMGTSATERRCIYETATATERRCITSIPLGSAPALARQQMPRAAASTPTRERFSATVRPVAGGGRSAAEMAAEGRRVADSKMTGRARQPAKPNPEVHVHESRNRKARSRERDDGGENG
jgi:hypothetical protein